MQQTRGRAGDGERTYKRTVHDRYDSGGEGTIDRVVTQRRTALVTGASAGIGAAFANVFASGGFDVVLVARREARLQQVAEQARRHGVSAHVVALDLSEVDAVSRLCDELSARELTIDALVNNAGYGVPGTFTLPRWTDQRAQLQVMVVAVTELTYRLLPGMLERGYGRIINVASLAGLVPAPAGHTLYPATKAFLIRFSEALSQEVAAAGVHVTALCPGFTLSEFHDRTGTRAEVSRLPTWMWMDAETVALEGYQAVMAGVPVYINGRVNRTLERLVRWCPPRLVRAVNRRFSRTYRKR
jgi:short-subunit dehydrogenase